MKKITLASLIIITVFSFANGQIFELEQNNSNNFNSYGNITIQNLIPQDPIQESENDDDIILDNKSEEVIIAAQRTVQSHKWMKIVQASERDYLLIESLLQNGQKVDASIFDGNSLINLAVWQDDEKLLRLGLQYGGNLHNINKKGETVLHGASSLKEINILRIVLNEKVIKDFINKQDKMGRTPLHYNALKEGNIQIASTLFSLGADLNIKDSNGQTPLHYALILQKWNLANFYINNGADYKLKDNEGDGIDEYLFRKGDTKSFKMFLKYLTIENQNRIHEKYTGINMTP